MWYYYNKLTEYFWLRLGFVSEISKDIAQVGIISYRINDLLPALLEYKSYGVSFQVMRIRSVQWCLGPFDPGLQYML